MDLIFKVMIHVGRPVQTCSRRSPIPSRCHPISPPRASARLEPGQDRDLGFREFPGAFPVEVDEVVPNEKIVLQRGRTSSYARSITPAGYDDHRQKFKPTDDGPGRGRGGRLARHRGRAPGS